MLNDVYCTSFRQMEVIDKNTPHSEFQISGTTLISYIAQKIIMNSQLQNSMHQTLILDNEALTHGLP